ncbi:WbqC family protein [Desulfovibrio litoralis]|uniref:WbqC-like protein family protein n=1 Tax=Desulfovibrio litoralis DSM 11393 TaxID=1121455 RepID=A0A1M7T256_9BACT|nr:WbqC family protein [Desulfovibrio litoralis]SHN64754.1 WbqC-like protein family protein [Desulfovibrio litoralis DSM 11393]
MSDFNMKKVAILQSNYIPWKGYFDMVAAVDEFIIYDDMQYTRRDWRNRNLIKTAQGLQWLTVPVVVKGQYEQTIKDTKIENSSWQGKHWKTFLHQYKKSLCFKEISDWLEPLYIQEEYTHLSQLNQKFIQAICSYLGIKTKITCSWDYTLVEGKTERLADLCKKAGGTEYISGPAAKGYIIPDIFEEYNIKLTWFDYIGYKEYPQLYGNFEHGVSILDLLFNCGKNSANYMRFVNI